jgi:hypothetical protein
MTTAERIYRHAQHLPEAQALEVLDFIDFLKQKQQARQVTTDWKTRLHKIPVINIEADDIEADLLRFERQIRYDCHWRLPMQL